MYARNKLLMNYIKWSRGLWTGICLNPCTADKYVKVLGNGAAQLVINEEDYDLYNSEHIKW